MLNCTVALPTSRNKIIVRNLQWYAIVVTIRMKQCVTKNIYIVQLATLLWGILSGTAIEMAQKNITVIYFSIRVTSIIIFVIFSIIFFLI